MKKKKTTGFKNLIQVMEEEKYGFKIKLKDLNQLLNLKEEQSSDF